MNQVVASKLKDAERAEMEVVLAALSHTPRLEKFLRYIAERYFQNRVNEINEYNIATEVLGRSKSSFDASRDSIARVEAPSIELPDVGAAAEALRGRPFCVAVGRLVRDKRFDRALEVVRERYGDVETRNYSAPLAPADARA